MHDQLDLSALRLSQNYLETSPTVKVVLAIPIGKPNRQQFVRVHPDPEWVFHAGVLEIKESKEIFIVHQSLIDSLGNDVVLKEFVLAVDRNNNPLLWVARLPGPDGTLDQWNETARRAMNLARTKWTKIASGSGGYNVFNAVGDLAEPIWPDMSFEEILRLAFKDKVIDSQDHPVLKKLRGQI